MTGEVTFTFFRCLFPSFLFPRTSPHTFLALSFYLFLSSHFFLFLFLTLLSFSFPHTYLFFALLSYSFPHTSFFFFSSHLSFLRTSFFFLSSHFFSLFLFLFLAMSHFSLFLNFPRLCLFLHTCSGGLCTRVCKVCHRIASLILFLLLQVATLSEMPSLKWNSTT